MDALAVLEPAAQGDHARTMGSYSFLNHSTSTIPQNLPPNVDDRPMVRQRRKRTCPEDQYVLEEAFKRDPKPDKAARSELVKRVSLGEKEVQIWFQNRRQSSRRKSRPLLPHEVAHYQMLRNASTDRDSESFQVSYRLGESESASGTDQAADPDSPEDGKQSVPRGATLAVDSESHDAERCESANKDGRPQILSKTIGYLANRRSAHALQSGETADDELRAFQRGFLADQSKKSSHCVRLSMTAEGKAEVITKDASSPSPPRPVQGPIATSFPQIGHTPIRMTPLTIQPTSRSSIGRSRDSRSWEFWCDKDSRAQFETAAERDATGSAAGAIGLLRSASGRSILGSMPLKRNIGNLAPVSAMKRMKINGKRPPLQRSRTSTGRLQSDVSTSTHCGTTPKLKHSESASFASSMTKRSDKENVSPEWVPGTAGLSKSPSDQSLAPGDLKGEALIDAGAVLGSSKGRPRSRPAGDTSTEDCDPEVEDFMDGGRRSTSASEHDDLDCIQGLLSLSQGNWK